MVSKQREVDSRETSLVIDHEAGVFHVTSNRVSMARHLKQMAQRYQLDIQESFGHVTLSNVPTSLLSKLSLPTYCKSRTQAVEA